MNSHRSIVTKVLLGSLLVACLPRFPEGERGVQCWTDRAIDQTECNRVALWCLERAVDEAEAEECFTEAARCEATSEQRVEQCEQRSGCIATRNACEDECRSTESFALECLDDCETDFLLCAPSLELVCERQCEDPLIECLSGATQIYHQPQCDREHLDCLLTCYDRDPNDGGTQGACDAGRFRCDDGRIEACVNGNATREYSCDQICAEQGRESNGCSDDDCSCQGMPGGDTTCERGTTVFCDCAEEFGVPCSSDDAEVILLQCVEGVGLPIECFASFFDDFSINCEVAFNTCECPYTNDGECDEPEGTAACPEGTDVDDC
jgi:hypothetical protein